MIETTCSFIALTSLFTDFRHRRLTYREWVPYNYSSFLTFCFTYAQQMSSTFHVATINVACDTLICGFLMHVCCQIAILEYRLKKLTRNQINMSYCIRHHEWIYKLVKITLKSIELFINNIVIKVIFFYLIDFLYRNYEKKDRSKNFI